MKKLIYTLALAGTLTFFTACDKADEILNELGLTSQEAADGLKEALDVGTDTAVKILSIADGYYKDEIVKILLPAEAKPVFDNLSKIPGGEELVEKTVLAINRAAEDAATTATPIFKDAIMGISFNDALSILNSYDTAATMYLKDNTYSSLYDAFLPKINTSLSKPLVFNTSAEDTYESLISAYNTASLNGVLFPKITENTLSEHVTNRALSGLFHKVGVEEKKIRNDIGHRVNDLLKKVFKK